ncbi:MAG TPA: hypothetical protein VFA30_08890 [Gaiellaceae bacterium]|nr:hypothetical protein [Gaiellaceae bacterium]
MRRSIPLIVLAAALALVPRALAVGPSLPAVSGAALDGYSTRAAGTSTRLTFRSDGAVVRARTLTGRWGIQLATLGGALTGLSANGRVLVLSDNVSGQGTVRARSRFAVVDTRTLTIAHTIALRGDFSVDAVSPAGRTLYLIHHVSGSDATRYQVVAYDLRQRRLLPGVVADKSQAGWIMAGYPVARVASPDGRWVYTLYRQNRGYAFVHALDTATRVAICVGIPVTDPLEVSSATLRLQANTVDVVTGGGHGFAIDRRTFRVRDL